MHEIDINEEFTISYPEGFHVMTDEEWSKLNVLEDGPGVGLSDPDRHIIVTVGWKQVGGLTAKLIKGPDLVKNMEKRIRKAMAPWDYKNKGFSHRSVADSTAEGVGYTYRVQDTGMYAESYAMSRGRTLYYLHFYVRQEFKEEGLPVWEEMLASARKK